MTNNNINEVWKPVNVEGFSEIYEVSNFGNIRNIKTQKILKTLTAGCGYQDVILCDKGKRKQIKVHRVVALTFIENPENKPEVNHINGNKEDNRVENLEFCTHQENIYHYHQNLRIPKKNNRKTPVAMYKKNGEYICTYDSVNHLMCEFPTEKVMVQQVLNKQVKTYKGYIFKYVQTD